MPALHEGTRSDGVGQAASEAAAWSRWALIELAVSQRRTLAFVSTNSSPSDPPFSAEQQQKRARRMRFANHFTRPLLSLPFQTPISKRLMLAEITGRKSGRIYNNR